MNRRYQSKSRSSNWIKPVKKYFQYFGPNFSKKAFNSRVGMVSKLAKSVSNIKSVLNVEYKHFDKTTILSPDTAGLVYHLTNIPEGDDYNQRNGRSIKSQSLYIRGEVAINTTIATNNSFPYYYRLIFLIDNECKGVAPTVADVLQAVDWNSPLNIDNGKQFTILYDEVHNLDPSNQRSHAMKFYKKIGHHIRYQGVGSSITDSRQGQLFVLALSNEPNPSYLPTFNFYSRIRYIDN